MRTAARPMAMMNTPVPSMTRATSANTAWKSTVHNYQSGSAFRSRLAGADVLVQVEDVGRVVRRLQRNQPLQLGRRERAADRVAVQRVHVRPVRVWRQRRGVFPDPSDPGLVLGRVVPARRGDELEQRVPMTEGRVLIRYVGDRTAVRLQTRRHPGRRQQGADRLVGQRLEVVPLPVTAVPMSLQAVVTPLQLPGRRLPDDLT